MKYIKVTHIESGNEEFYPINNVILVEKVKDDVIIHIKDYGYTHSYDTKEYDIQEVNTLF